MGSTRPRGMAIRPVVGPPSYDEVQQWLLLLKGTRAQGHSAQGALRQEQQMLQQHQQLQRADGAGAAAAELVGCDLLCTPRFPASAHTQVLDTSQ
eukprot:1158672-Pelagomonas_calceolata.AAC.5